MNESSIFSAFSPTLVIASLLNFSYSTRNTEVSHYGFHLASLMTDDTVHLFLRLSTIYIFSLVKCLSKYFYALT